MQDAARDEWLLAALAAALLAASLAALLGAARSAARELKVLTARARRKRYAPAKAARAQLRCV